MLARTFVGTSELTENTPAIELTGLLRHVPVKGMIFGGIIVGIALNEIRSAFQKAFRADQKERRTA